MLRLLTFTLSLLIALSSHAEVLSTRAPAFTATINVDETTIPDGLLIQVTLTNASSETIRFLKWGTPFENGFNDDMFQVWQANAPIPYTGKLIKRGQPSAKDFIALEAGESLTQTVDITDGYAAYEAGDYTISFNSTVSMIEGDPAQFKSDGAENNPDNNPDKMIEQRMASASITANLSLDRYPLVAKQTPAFSSCDSAERNTLHAALTQAEIIAEESSRILANTPTHQRSGAPRYSTWFGNYQSSRYAIVSEHFDRIYDVMANRQVTFDCNCDVDSPNSTFAYVFPNKPYRIHLCGQFWRAAMTGQDSKAGTLIHEISHFYKVASTDDHAYGRSSVRNLARQNPDLAIENADGYEYFAENTPALSMGISQSELDNTPKLNINQPASARIARGEWLYYRVSDASKIILSNMSEDFDLYVKAGSQPSFFDYDCRPFHSGTRTETCGITNTNKTIYVGVHALLDSGTFTLLAEGQTPASQPRRGLWWNPQRDGTGYDIQIDDDQLAVIWYTYAKDRSPVWYLASGTFLNNQGNATIRKYTWDKGQGSWEEIGKLQLKFKDSTHANLSWSNGTQSGAETIEFFVISNQTPQTDHSGIWYEPAQPGYGMTLVEQGSVIITVLYFYDANGQPTWALGDNQDNYQLNSYQGSCPYCLISPTSHKQVGNLSFNLFNTGEGTLSTRVKLNSPLSGNWNISNATIKNLAP